MKKIILLILLSVQGILFSQTLIQTVDLPTGTVWNSAYGLVYADGKYWVTSSSTSAAKKIYGLNSSGIQTDEITINYYTLRESQGIAHDGTDFWYVERKTSRSDLYKVSSAGVVLDSIILSTINGGTSWYLGGAAWDGSGLWISVYSPDASTALFKINTTTKQFVDTIYLPAGQMQPQGLTVKGDTLFCVNDSLNAANGLDMIYAFNKNSGELIYSFRPPERPGQRIGPKGLAWDGQHFWLMAEPIGASSGRKLYVYDLAGNGTPGVYLLNPTLAFGNVQIDSSSDMIARITNYGTASLIIDSVIISSSVYSLLNSLPLSIGVGETKELNIRFTPAANLTYADSIKLFHNFKAVPFTKITVSGKGVYTSSYITFEPSVLSFGDKRVNSTSYITVTMRNLGAALLTVDSVKVSSQDFRIEGFTGPVNIDTISPKSFKVWFNPTGLQNYNAVVTVYSNAGNGAVKTLTASGNGVNPNTALGTEVWSGIIPNNPKTTYNDLSIKVIKKIQDINNDGIEDVVVTTDNYWVIAYNGNSSVSSDILWQFNTYINSSNAGSVELVQNLQFADVNSDGMQDVIIGTQGGNEAVYALNGKTGEIIWEFGFATSYDGDIMGVDAKRDWNNDGVNDVIVSASGDESNGQGRFSVFMLNGVNGNLIWTINQSAQQKLKYDVTSTSNGGAFGTRVGSSYEVVGFNPQGLITWSFPSANTPWRLGEIQNIGGDNHTDIIAGCFGGQVYALSSDAGVQIWMTSIGNVIIEDLRVIQDINGNGVQDIFVSGIAPYAYLLEGANGNILWSRSVGGNILGIGSLPDMTGDALPELGIGDLSNLLTVVNSVTGSPIFTYSFGTGSNYAAEMISGMGEIDGVGAGEFIAGSRGGRLIVFAGGPDGIVPVEMTSFTAAVNKNQVILNWTSATELNNKGFAIERRTQESSFAEIHFMQGNGTTSEKSSYTYIDTELPYGEYYYRLAQVDYDGTTTYSKEIKAEVGIPLEYSLEQNYPNPFNPVTVIRYALPYEGSVKLKIYNSLGEEVRTLVNGVQQPGNYYMEWNGKNNNNINVPSGVYIYRLETDRFTSSKKMMMIK